MVTFSARFSLGQSWIKVIFSPHSFNISVVASDMPNFWVSLQCYIHTSLHLFLTTFREWQPLIHTYFATYILGCWSKISCWLMANWPLHVACMYVCMHTYIHTYIHTSHIILRKRDTPRYIHTSLPTCTPRRTDTPRYIHTSLYLRSILSPNICSPTLWTGLRKTPDDVILSGLSWTHLHLSAHKLEGQWRPSSWEFVLHQIPGSNLIEWSHPTIKSTMWWLIQREP